MFDQLLISNINDFIFCPISIYFHRCYGSLDSILYHNSEQIEGKLVHSTIDEGSYSTLSNLLVGIPVYSEKYNLFGKIDIYYINEQKLIERKRHISRIFDGQIFQLYAQKYALEEMGYSVRLLQIRSYNDNKVYEINLPENDNQMKEKFEKIVREMRDYNIENFLPTSIEKCKRCVYSSLCDRSLDVEL